MILVSSCCCLCSIHWGQLLSREWRCSWSSTDRRCSNYIWMIINFISINVHLILEVWLYLSQCHSKIQLIIFWDNFSCYTKDTSLPAWYIEPSFVCQCFMCWIELFKGNTYKKNQLAFLKHEMVELKSFLMEDRVVFMLWNQYHGFWWPGDTRSQCISSHCIDQALLEYLCFRNRSDQKSGTLIARYPYILHELTST